MAGYSKRSLVDKLGIKQGFKFIIVNPPANYTTSLGELPDNVIKIFTLKGSSADFIQFFTKSQVELRKNFPALKKALVPNGMLWISWPKGSSKVAADLNENVVREIGLEGGLVDVKVCAVDDVWSGLKFVFRLKDRPKIKRRSM